jgi:hypothetical protein
VDQIGLALTNALNLPKFIQPLHEELQSVKAILQSGITVQQQINQLVGIITHLLKENASLKEEIRSLKETISKFMGG